jgi:hypothetical protein
MSARSYLTYEGPDDLCVTMGLCDAVPRTGESVWIDYKRYVVSSVELTVIVNSENPSDYPVQHVTVRLKPAKRSRK